MKKKMGKGSKHSSNATPPVNHADFRLHAVKVLAWGTRDDDDDDQPIAWTDVLDMLEKLEMGYNPLFNDVETKEHAGPLANMDLANSTIAARQRELGETLWHVDSELALQIADLMRAVPPDPGLSRTKRRADLLEEIDRLAASAQKKGQTPPKSSGRPRSYTDEEYRKVVRVWFDPHCSFNTIPEMKQAMGWRMKRDKIERIIDAERQARKRAIPKAQ